MHLLCPGALVLAYPVAQPDAMPARADDAITELLGQAGVVAVRLADLVSPRGGCHPGATARHPRCLHSP
jgi:hypothetical protein